MLKFGVIGISRKQNERRLPLHPDHFDQIPQRVRGSMWFEKGYAGSLGVMDEQLTRRFGGVMDRDELLVRNDVRRAIAIREGVIRNPKVLSFQRRAAEYPHPIAP